ncbi:MULTISPECIES: PTS transporter subunit EIIC [Clostridia]|uniref:PTS transporter subunit EIIC n=1 Tax=Clostridia TaxID=186801 RepID=UPI00155DD12C|nr:MULTISPECIES: PTS transporter subunit EIIC [Clostridia]
MKYEKMCKEILTIIGQENIVDVFHCVTRLRFIAKDKEKVDLKKLGEVEGVLQVKIVGNQIQCIIGPHVGEVYEDLCKVGEFEQKPEIDEEVGEEKTEKKKITFNTFLEGLSSIFMPLISVFCAGGMIKCLSIILSSCGILADGSGTLTLLDAIGDAPFYFLPFMVAYTTAKRFKLNELLGLMVAGVLMYPTIMENAGSGINFIGIHITCYSYASTVIPTVLCVILMAYIYRFVDKLIPKNLSLVFTGMISFTVFMPLLLWIIAPLGNHVANVLSVFFETLFHVAGPLGGAVFTGVMPFLVMTGTHSTLDPIIIQNFAKTGMDYMFPAFFLNNFAVAGATIGAALRIKDKSIKAAAISNGGLGILGITEPALFGVCTKYKAALIGSVVGGAIGGALYMFFHVYSYAYAMPGIFSIASYADKNNNMLWMILCLAITFVVSFVIGFVMNKEEK